jgi:hypothetical protein
MSFFCVIVGLHVSLASCPVPVSVCLSFCLVEVGGRGQRRTHLSLCLLGGGVGGGGGVAMQTSGVQERSRLCRLTTDVALFGGRICVFVSTCNSAVLLHHVGDPSCSHSTLNILLP